MSVVIIKHQYTSMGHEAPEESTDILGVMILREGESLDAFNVRVNAQVKSLCEETNDMFGINTPVYSGYVYATDGGEFWE